MKISGLGVEMLPHPKRGAEGVLCAFAPFAREIPEDAGDQPIIRFVGNTSTEDRYGSVVDPKGAKLKNYLENPVFMQFHDYQRWPLGKALSVIPTASMLEFRILFAINEYDEANIAYRLYKADFVRGVSIGMIPLHWSEYEAKTVPIQFAENRIYDDWELLELSAAPIPANRNALKMALDQKVVSENELRAVRLDQYLELGREAPYVLLAASMFGTVEKKEVENTERAGKVLSRANEESLEQAVAQVHAALDSIEKVLASAKKAEPASTEPDPEDVSSEDYGIVEIECQGGCGMTAQIPEAILAEVPDLDTLGMICDECAAKAQTAAVPLTLEAIKQVLNPGDATATHVAAHTEATAERSEPTDSTRIQSYIDLIFEPLVSGQ